MRVHNLSGHIVPIALNGNRKPAPYSPEKLIMTFPATENVQTIDDVVIRSIDFRNRIEEFEPESLIFLKGGNPKRPRAVYMDSSGMMHTLASSYKSANSEVITSIICHSDAIHFDENGWPEIEPPENGVADDAPYKPDVVDNAFKLIDDIMDVKGDTPQEKYRSRVRLAMKALQ